MKLHEEFLNSMIFFCTAFVVIVMNNIRSSTLVDTSTKRSVQTPHQLVKAITNTSLPKDFCHCDIVTTSHARAAYRRGDVP
jgi:hypothetical protein